MAQPETPYKANLDPVYGSRQPTQRELEERANLEQMGAKYRAGLEHDGHEYKKRTRTRSRTRD